MVRNRSRRAFLTTLGAGVAGIATMGGNVSADLNGNDYEVTLDEWNGVETSYEIYSSGLVTDSSKLEPGDNWGTGPAGLPTQAYGSVDDDEDIWYITNGYPLRISFDDREGSDTGAWAMWNIDLAEGEHWSDKVEFAIHMPEDCEGTAEYSVQTGYVEDGNRLEDDDEYYSQWAEGTVSPGDRDNYECDQIPTGGNVELDGNRVNFMITALP